MEETQNAYGNFIQYIKYIAFAFLNFKYIVLFMEETNILEFICKISTAGDVRSSVALPGKQMTCTAAPTESTGSERNPNHIVPVVQDKDPTL